MSEQRQPFRFRLPWLAPQRSTTQPQRPRPTEIPRIPSQPTTSIPIQRPAFKPGGIAPTQPPPPPPPQPQPPPKAEPQISTPSPSRVAPEPQKESPSTTTTKPPSPSPIIQAPKATSQLAPSPSVAAPSAIVKPPLPSPTATESPKAEIQLASSPSDRTAITKPPSPSRAAAESSPTGQTADAKPPSPSRAVVESSPKATSQSASSPSGRTATPKPPSPARVSSQPASPSQARTQSRATSVPPSPSRGDPKSKASYVPPSPSRATSQAQPESVKSPQSLSEPPPTQKTTSEVSSPPRKATQLEPTVEIVSQSSSSPDKSKLAVQDSSKPPSSPTQPQLSAPQQEPKKEATSPPPLQEAVSNLEITSEAAKKTSPQDDVVVPTTRQLAEAPAQPEKLDSTTIDRDQKLISEMERDVKKPEEKKKTVEKLPKKEKKSRAAYEEQPVQKTIAELVTPVSGSQKDTRAKRHQKLEPLDKKETLATTGYIGKQIKAEDTSLSFQKPTSLSPIEEEAPRQKEIKEDISKLVHKLTTEPQLDEKSITVITLTGENKGASMHLSSEPVKKETSIRIHRDYKTNPDESSDTATDGERFGGQKRRQAPSPTAYVNSNVQSVNNSIVSNASVTERNPGVQLVFSQNSSEAIKSKGKLKSLEARKAESSITPAEKLTLEPIVRRRCLRGLFMEPSDSDPDNPDKPRRHGCHFSCGEKSNDTETGVL